MVLGEMLHIQGYLRTRVKVVEPAEVGYAVLRALIVTVLGEGMAAGATYTPAALMVPTVALPPTMSLTNHWTVLGVSGT